MKSTTAKCVFCMTFGPLLYGLALAGTLEPPGAPAPSMVTLQQVYDKLNGAVVGVPTTGQTQCWDATAHLISCAGTGQDGALQKGVSVSPRFTDNANGTVKDNLTGLIWLKNANCFGPQSWTGALAVSNTLASGACGLSDGSVAGNWRLPNVKELQSLNDFGQDLPAIPPGGQGGMFTSILLGYYWSSTSYMDDKNYAWRVDFSVGYVEVSNKSSGTFPVWPVRGGP